MKILNQITKLGLIAVFAIGVLSFVGCGEEKTPYERLQEAKEKHKK